MRKESDEQKAARRAKAALAAVAGIPTPALERVAAVGDEAARLAALSGEAKKRALA